MKLSFINLIVINLMSRLVLYRSVSFVIKLALPLRTPRVRIVKLYQNIRGNRSWRNKCNLAYYGKELQVFYEDISNDIYISYFTTNHLYILIVEYMERGDWFVKAKVI